MRKFALICAAVCQCSIPLAGGIVCGADDALRERFATEAPKLWLEYRRIVSRHTEIVETGQSTSNLNNEKNAYRVSGSLDLGRQCARFLYSDGGSCDVWNPEYYFQIAKEGEHKWKLVNVARTPAKPTKPLLPLTKNISSSLVPQPPVCRPITPEFPDDLIGRSRTPGSLKNRRTTFSMPMESACLGQHIWRDWLPYLISSADFRLVKIGHQGSNEQLVKVAFTFSPSVIDAQIDQLPMSGYVILDAQRYWLIREAEINGRYYDCGRKTLKIINEFKEFEDAGVRIPYVCHQLMTLHVPEGNKGKPFEQKWTTNVEMSVSKDRDGKQFRLPCFGLPEQRFDSEGKEK